MSIDSEKYVSITTFRKNGDPVSSPVWIARLADGTCGFTTDQSSGKVKRLRNDPKVTLRPCDMRGRIKPDAAESTGRASIVIGAGAAPIEAAIRSKYGLMAKVMLAASAVSERISKLRGKAVDEPCAIVITLD